MENKDLIKLLALGEFQKFSNKIKIRGNYRGEIMCEQCLAQTITLNENKPVIGEFFLVRATQDGSVMKSGDFGLVEQNDPTFIFSQKPELIPGPRDTFANTEDFFNWLERAKDFKEQLANSMSDLKGAYYLIKACYDAGYKDENGCVEYWLFEYLAPFVTA